MRLHHVNIRTTDLARSIDFYSTALGLTHGERPDFGFEGAWLYDDDKPAVHLNLAVEPPSPVSNAFDHMAFSVPDFDAAVARLERASVYYYGVRSMPDGKMRQCFMKDPNGVTVEINGP